jgi:fatty-acyl-CoA synthase
LAKALASLARSTLIGTNLKEVSGGWLHTGDVATIDTDGYVKITDRVKDMIRSGCEWISSLQLEDLILRHPGVAEAAVIGVPDPKWIERPLGLVVARACQEVSQEQNQSPSSGLCRKGHYYQLQRPGSDCFRRSLA